MIPVEDMPYHPTTEKIVQILMDKTQATDPHYFRVLVGYYFSMAAAHMRCSILTQDRKNIPINMYALNLAPSGFGKGVSSGIMANEVLKQFRHRFLSETFRIKADESLEALALERAAAKRTNLDNEMALVTKEFTKQGSMVFSFDSGTAPAVKQLRHKLLMADVGALNLIMDEVGSNLSNNKDLFDAYIELYDTGYTGTKLLKNTYDNSRDEEIVGQTPTNLLMFGVPSRLLDGGKTEEELMSMLRTGYARRCFFGYADRNTPKRKLSIDELYALKTNPASFQVLEDLDNHLATLASTINLNKKLTVSEETTKELLRYDQYCQERAENIPAHLDIQESEMRHRYFKVLKLAGAYAFVDDSLEISIDHIHSAIRVAEDSGAHLQRLLNQEKSFVKLAKYIAAVGEDITQAELTDALPFYKGSASAKAELMTLAISYGYKNNIVIKKRFDEGIEFISGETLKETDLDKMTLAYSTDITKDYSNEYAPFDKLHLLTQASGMHWVTHHLINGYRNEENSIAGFNLLVLDVDTDGDIPTTRAILRDYKYHLYTTKSHTDQNHCFRIILPLSHELKLSAQDYKEFMNNVYDWLPFGVDRQTNQRSRKWLAHANHFEYNEGKLFDPFPFIPKTTRNEARKQIFDNQQNFDALERWVINNTGEGNRNVMLHRYSMIFIDAGLSFEDIYLKITTLNDKLPDKLTADEINNTIMKTVSTKLLTRDKEAA